MYWWKTEYNYKKNSTDFYDFSSPGNHNSKKLTDISRFSMAVGTLAFLLFDKLSEDKLPLHIALIQQALCLRAQMWWYNSK